MKKKVLIIIGIIIAVIASIILYARFIGTSGLIVKEYKITNSSIPDSFYGTKIVQLSDIHFGRTIDNNNLEKIVKKINSLKPDIIVLTGDLLDKDYKITEAEEQELIKNLKNLQATIGKYAITGNHDYEFENWATIIAESNFTNLNDKYDIIYNGSTKPIFLGGLSTNSYQKEKTLEEKIKIMNDYFNTINDQNKETSPDYKILIMHEPDYVDEINPGNYDLILAGHSHNGQVRMPLIGAIILPPGAEKYYDEYYNINGTDFYISSGIGTSRHNYRLFNKPSINLFRLVNY